MSGLQDKAQEALLVEALRDTRALERSACGLFVYGTLMRGGRAHHRIERHRIINIVEAEMSAKLVLVDWYPGLVLDREATVVGEWVEVEDLDGLLRELDVYEEFSGYHGDSAYWRVIRAVRAGQREGFAWVYAYAQCRAGLEEIPSGDWRRYLLSDRT